MSTNTFFSGRKMRTLVQREGTPIPAKKRHMDSYSGLKPIFEITKGGATYSFFEKVFEGEISDIYRGIKDAKEDDIAYIKVAISPLFNEYIDNEFQALHSITNISLPTVEHEIKINKSHAIIMREMVGIPLTELLEQYSLGVPPSHVMWMLERLLRVVGYLHLNHIVHGNIKPENIIVNKDNHNMILHGFAFSVRFADQTDARYKIASDYYTAPEVNKDAIVLPSSDIYSIGMIAIKLLGGDVTSSEIPFHVDPKVRAFIMKMVNPDVGERPNDAWILWDELKKLRIEVFGNQRFQKIY